MCRWLAKIAATLGRPTLKGLPVQHKCKLTVIRKELYPDLQAAYLADPQSGPCPFYQVGDEFVFERYRDRDDFWTMGRGSQCSEAWDCISRYVYTALQGGAPMRGWCDDERVMVACCNDGTRPVVFKIERIDYQVLYLNGLDSRNEGDPVREQAVRESLLALEGVNEVVFDRKDGWTEIVVDREVPFDELAEALEAHAGVTLERAE